MTPVTSIYDSPRDEHRSSGNFFSFYLELYKNKFKNLISTSKFKLSFRGLLRWENYGNSSRLQSFNLRLVV